PRGRWFAAGHSLDGPFASPFLRTGRFVLVEVPRDMAAALLTIAKVPLPSSLADVVAAHRSGDSTLDLRGEVRERGDGRHQDESATFNASQTPAKGQQVEEAGRASQSVPGATDAAPSTQTPGSPVDSKKPGVCPTCQSETQALGWGIYWCRSCPR